MAIFECLDSAQQKMLQEQNTSPPLCQKYLPIESRAQTSLATTPSTKHARNPTKTPDISCQNYGMKREKHTIDAIRTVFNHMDGVLAARGTRTFEELVTDIERYQTKYRPTGSHKLLTRSRPQVKDLLRKITEGKKRFVTKEQLLTSGSTYLTTHHCRELGYDIRDGSPTSSDKKATTRDYERFAQSSTKSGNQIAEPGNFAVCNSRKRTTGPESISTSKPTDRAAALSMASPLPGAKRAIQSADGTDKPTKSRRFSFRPFEAPMDRPLDHAQVAACVASPYSSQLQPRHGAFEPRATLMDPDTYELNDTTIQDKFESLHDKTMSAVHALLGPLEDQSPSPARFAVLPQSLLRSLYCAIVGDSLDNQRPATFSEGVSSADLLTSLVSVFLVDHVFNSPPIFSTERFMQALQGCVRSLGVSQQTFDQELRLFDRSLDSFLRRVCERHVQQSYFRCEIEDKHSEELKLTLAEALLGHLNSYASQCAPQKRNIKGRRFHPAELIGAFGRVVTEALRLQCEFCCTQKQYVMLWASSGQDFDESSMINLRGDRSSVDITLYPGLISVSTGQEDKIISKMQVYTRIT